MNEKILEKLEEIRKTDKIYDACRTIIDNLSGYKDDKEILTTIKQNENVANYYQEMLQGLNKKRIKTRGVKFDIDFYTRGLEDAKDTVEKFTKLRDTLTSLGYTLDEALDYALDVEMKAVKEYIKENIDTPAVRKCFMVMFRGASNQFDDFEKSSFKGKWFKLREPCDRVTAMIDSYTAEVTMAVLYESGLKQVEVFLNNKSAEDITTEDLEK